MKKIFAALLVVTSLFFLAACEESTTTTTTTPPGQTYYNLVLIPGLGEFAPGFEVPTRYNADNGLFVLPGPTQVVRPGFVFDGWFEAFDLSSIRHDNITQGTTGNLILFARWVTTEVRITFHESDGTQDLGAMATDRNPGRPWIPGSIGSEVRPTQVAGNPLNMQFENLPHTLINPAERNGYRFEGWYTNYVPTPAARVTQITAENIHQINRLFAVFTPDSDAQRFDITYNLNGGSWNHHNVYQLMTHFLTDLHRFMLANGHDADPVLENFMHAPGYDPADSETHRLRFRGTWQAVTNHAPGGTAANQGNAAAIGSIVAAVDGALWSTVWPARQRDFVNQNLFWSNDEMRAKWLNFGDRLDAYVNAVNAAQWFWNFEGSGSVGNIRLPQFAVNNFAWVNNANFMPEMANMHPFFTSAGIVALQPVFHATLTFQGWYTTADFQEGTRVTSIPAGSTGAMTLHARFA